MKKILRSHTGTILSLGGLFFLAYALLLKDRFFPTSISSIVSISNHMEVKTHLIVLGLLPIYIALMIFGSALLGLYFGPSVHDFLFRTFRDK